MSHEDNEATEGSGSHAGGTPIQGFDFTTLTSPEQFVLDSIRQGAQAAFAFDEDPDARPLVRAAFLRHLLLKLGDAATEGWRRPAAGLVLTNARVTGALDLQTSSIRSADGPVSLCFTNCAFDAPIGLAASSLGSLVLDNCLLAGLYAPQARIEGLVTLSKVQPRTGECAIVLAGARIDGRLNLTQARLVGSATGRVPPEENQGGPQGPSEQDRADIIQRGFALDLSNAHIQGPALMGHMNADGAVNLHNTYVEGDFDLNGAVVSHGANPKLSALQASQLHVDGDLVAVGLVCKGVLDLSGCKVRGGARFVGARVSPGPYTRPGVRLMALNGAEFGGAVVLGQVDQRRTIIQGEVCAINAKLHDQLIIANATVHRGSPAAGPSLNFYGAQIESTVFLGPKLTCKGSMNFSGTRIRSTVLISQVEAHNIVETENGPAFGISASFASADVTSDISIENCHFKGAIRLEGARLAGGLTLGTCEVEATHGASIFARGLSVGLNLMLRDLQLTGSAIFEQAAIKGDVTWTGLHFKARGPEAAMIAQYGSTPKSRFPRFTAALQDQTLLDLQSARIEGDLNAFKLSHDGILTISMLGARVSRLQDDLEIGWGERNETVLLLDNFEYAALPTSHGIEGIGRKVQEIGGDLEQLPQETANSMFWGHIFRSRKPAWKGRLAWVRKRYCMNPSIGQPNVFTYSPQPYEHLSRVLRTSGQVEDARQIAVYQRRDGRRAMAPWRVPLSYLFDRICEYGFSPFRASVSVLMTYLLGLGLILAADANDQVVLDYSPRWAWSAPEGVTLSEAQADQLTADEPLCPPGVNRPLLALDMALPLIELGEARECTVRHDSGGENTAWPWRWAVAVYQILATIVLSLAILTFSGVMRRDASG